MKKALEYLASYEEPASVTYEGVAAEIARLEDLRTRTVDDPLRPITVRRNIQYACAEAGRPVRPTDVLETAKAELDRIMAEDLPRMACADDSLVQNATGRIHRGGESARYRALDRGGVARTRGEP